MNFYGHAFIASRHRAEPGFVFGAMLPDFEGMARVRVLSSSDAAISDGIAYHHDVDEAFHGAPGFVASCAQSVVMLTARGLPRGAARAIAHVGLELVLDAFIVRTHGYVALYESALAEGRDKLSTLAFRTGTDAAALDALLVRLLDFGPPGAEDDADFVTTRLVRMLRDRPRLAIPEDLVEEVASHVRYLARATTVLGPELIEAASTAPKRART